MRKILSFKVDLQIVYTATDPDVPPYIERVLVDDVPFKIDRISELSDHIREIAAEDAYNELTPKPSVEEMLNWRNTR